MPCNCTTLQIDLKTCILDFNPKADRKKLHAYEKEFETVNGDLMIIHLDENDKIVEIELIGDKPCQ